MVRRLGTAFALSLAAVSSASSSSSSTSNPHQAAPQHPFRFLLPGQDASEDVGDVDQKEVKSSVVRKQNDERDSATLALTSKAPVNTMMNANQLPLSSITPEFSINDEMLKEPDSGTVVDETIPMFPVGDEDLIMEDETDENSNPDGFDDKWQTPQARAVPDVANQRMEAEDSSLGESLALNTTKTKAQKPLRPFRLSLPFRTRRAARPARLEDEKSIPSSEKPRPPLTKRWRPRLQPSKPCHLSVEVQSSVSPKTSKRRTANGARRSYSEWREMDQTEPTRTTAYGADRAEVILDPSSAISLATQLYRTVNQMGLAFVGTLRLLAPMVFARRLLAYVAYVIGDWYTGRYLRKKYETFGQHYWRYYEVPAALRSCGRILTQTLFVSIMGLFAEWFLLVEITQSCELAGGGCVAWSCISWVLVVLASARTVGSFIANKTPLRIKVCTRIQPTSRRPRRKILLRPWFLIKCLRDPDALMRPENLIRGRDPSLRPFTPNAMLLPASWPPLRFLQVCAVVQCLIKQHVGGEIRSVHRIMRLVLIQEIMQNEWQRVLMVERRVALGIPLVSSYSLATLSLFFAIGEVSGTSALLILPSLMAVLVSVWMNIFLYFERRVKKRTNVADEQKQINQRLT